MDGATRLASRPHSPAAIACFALTLLLHLASGSGTLETAILVVTVENQFGDTCSTLVAEFCLLHVSGDGTLQNLTVNTYQRIEYVGIATDFSLFREHAGEYWLLEDRSVTLRGQDLYLPNPALRILTETWQQVPELIEDYWLRMNSTGVSVDHYGPSTTDPTGEWDVRAFHVEYSSEQGVGYEQIGPLNAPAGSSTDRYVAQLPNATCFWKDMPVSDCRTFSGGIVDRSHNLTPNVLFGAEFYDLQVATDPSNLSYNSPLSPLPNALTAGMDRQDNEEPGVVDETNDTRLGVPEEPQGERKRGSPRSSIDPVPEGKGHVDILAEMPPSLPPDLPLAVILAGAATAGLLAVLGAMLYSRFHNRREVLQSEMRSRLVEIVRQNPGICVADAARELGIVWNAAQHHVKMLKRLGILRTEAEGRRKGLYLAGSNTPQEDIPKWIHSNPVSHAIFSAIKASPEGIGRDDVRQLLPETPERTRNYHIQRLLGAGAISLEITPDGRKRLRIASAG